MDEKIVEVMAQRRCCGRKCGHPIGCHAMFDWGEEAFDDLAALRAAGYAVVPVEREICRTCLGAEEVLSGRNGDYTLVPCPSCKGDRAMLAAAKE